MNTNYRKHHNSHPQGFSLVELLATITVIGVIAAMAIPQFANINGTASMAKDQRNAQSVVNTFMAGTAAGVTWTTTDRNTAVADVIAGRTPSTGAFSGRTFQVPGVTGTDLTGAYAYIGLNADGTLFYDKAGNQPKS